MKAHNRELLVLLKTPDTNEEELEKQLEELHAIARQAESNEAFCRAHELVKRFKITQRRSVLLNAISEPVLKPFYFLINKN
ncbi:MAG: hypothetical protein C4329_02625 [Chitinophagaceae bacterium]